MISMTNPTFLKPESSYILQQTNGKMVVCGIADTTAVESDNPEQARAFSGSYLNQTYWPWWTFYKAIEQQPTNRKKK